MTESQRKWLLYLQSKGVRFAHNNLGLSTWYEGSWKFYHSAAYYNITFQSIPDIPDWRELCREMQSAGVKFENVSMDGTLWFEGTWWEFITDIEDYRIPEQPMPEWREEMTEETKPEPREEIPHRELQIQWYEDWLHHLRTGEPMQEWERRSKLSNVWMIVSVPDWRDAEEYRRKPRTITYWHCVGGYMDSGGKKDTMYFASGDWNGLLSETERYKARFPLAKFSPITETTVEMED